ncbi:MAG: hypothetical protein KDK36_11745 [Leptospiraceae bacterium]|nr:hypothetical protein [Leptospiraceae bacterium]
MNTFIFLFILITFTAILRLVELNISLNNKVKRQKTKNWSEVKEGYFFLFVILHILFLFSVPFEVYFLKREFYHWLAWPSLLIFISCLIARVHILSVMGKYWNVRIIYNTSEDSIVTNGIYQYIRHPNYLVVILEIFSLSLFHTAFYSMLTFSIANIILLSLRIPKEEKYLFSNPQYKKHFENKKRFIPGIF